MEAGFVGVSGFATGSTVVSRSTCAFVPGKAFAVKGGTTLRSNIKPAVAAESKNSTVMSMSEVETKARAELTKLFEKTPCMPLMVRLAWHDAGTYDKETKTGGANASIRFDPEITHGANAGLKIAIDLLEPIKQAVPEISYADLYQLASIHGIEFAGGPKIPFKLGREDAPDPAKCTEDGRLPDANERMPHLRNVFYRMGMTDQEIIALSGAHTLGRAHSDRSGFEDKAWTVNPLTFDNAYFVELLAKNNPALLRLNSDEALLDEEQMMEIVKLYAENKDKFFEDYSAAHLKLSELGCSL
mmetsp:Transcript_11855/g.21438  ORF Transcript_11855/g.21438 Transcript_11855/m.21438 type:complete len:300 (-) Transcript_11855:56-955(-)|eukprot:CAMPEP_0182447048 /NCGR_PEP_ID=MMETSP1172-20130603/10750_1 /TAXON_ID=708627 /ORGANISM="Timspurckia oligopyrenoides, Strain CCMP3278" /LENGTH=299 /DNA_ID=CAMNT_0024643325 /DNA_START=151 /DNA_END=1050 /DNA_ORIENTATION=-